ncbi:hypothetical protein CALVIDRAFT_17181 [Calocera viscosa TUFC12733]|uniref:Uncharacterized protein n=1 Tax=Calocera viscosa (strain TUFC12733) TaxID=1330018 RepID=A0A167SB62_CALVF|nr:hypothetical protein CALVIDRAFT_17181 [Calocera viscosa TUFC12733]
MSAGDGGPRCTRFDLDRLSKVGTLPLLVAMLELYSTARSAHTPNKAISRHHDLGLLRLCFCLQHKRMERKSRGRRRVSPLSISCSYLWALAGVC